MKTLKITDKAWEALMKWKLIAKTKSFSEAILMEDMYHDKITKIMADYLNDKGKK